MCGGCQKLLPKTEQIQKYESALMDHNANIHAQRGKTNEERQTPLARSSGGHRILLGDQQNANLRRLSD